MGDRVVQSSRVADAQGVRHQLHHAKPQPKQQQTRQHGIAVMGDVRQKQGDADAVQGQRGSPVRPGLVPQ